MKTEGTFLELNAVTYKPSFQRHASYSVFLLIFYVEELENLDKMLF